MSPGTMQLVSTPACASSAESARVSPMIPTFAAEMCAPSCPPWNADRPLRLMMRPQPRATMPGAAARAVMNAASRSIAITSRQSSYVMSRNSLLGRVAALFTTMSMPP